MPFIFITDRDGSKKILGCQKGEILRDVLLTNGINPYTSITTKYNCGGNGICATCGVFISEEVNPTHWHDRLAKAFQYPRLSCKIKVMKDLHIEIPEKVIWGKRRSETNEQSIANQ